MVKAAKGSARSAPAVKGGQKRLGKEPPELKTIPFRGRIVRILHGQSFGFLRTDDDRDVFFHRSDIGGDVFNSLVVGDAVAGRMFEDRITGPRALKLRKRQS